MLIVIKLGIVRANAQDVVDVVRRFAGSADTTRIVVLFALNSHNSTASFETYVERELRMQCPDVAIVPTPIVFYERTFSATLPQNIKAVDELADRLAVIA